MDGKLSKKLSVYNLVFTICIVVFHSKNSYQLFASTQNSVVGALYNFYYTFGDISLGVFFMISGYLFYLGINNMGRLKEKVKGRVNTLVVPFFVWNALMLVYEVAYSFCSGSLSLNIKDVVAGFTYDPFDGPLWYMFTLIVLITFSPLLVKLKNYPIVFKAGVGATIVFAFLWGVLAEEQLNDNGLLHWVSETINYLPLYVIGAYFGALKSDLVVQEKYNKKVISVISAVIITLSMMYFIFFDVGIQWLNWVLFHILPLAIWLLVSSEHFEKNKITFPLKATFFVYAMHMLLVGITNTILFKIFGYNNLHWVLAIVLHFAQVAGIFAFCTCFAFVGKKILPQKLFATLSGGRVK